MIRTLRWVTFLFLYLTILGCAPEPRVVYITATFPPDTGSVTDTQIISTEAIPPPPGSVSGDFPTAYTVQPGDTLSLIAAQHNTTVSTLIELNAIEDPNLIAVGQVIELPPPPVEQTPAASLFADRRVIRTTEGAAFDVEGFIAQQPGFIRSVTDEVDSRTANGVTITETLTAAEVLRRISREFRIDPRLLLALLEHRANWLSETEPDETLQEYPIVPQEASSVIDRKGLYRQLAWASNELNRAYYGWKYRGWSVIEFEDGPRLRYNADLNPGTVGIQYLLSLSNSYASWQRDVAPDGFVSTYAAYFGDPLSRIDQPLIAEPGIGQPEFGLPFARDNTWFYTGGPHGGWGSGSAWAALDFAPPDDRADNALCFTSEFWATAVAPGIIARSERGVVVLDLDGDGDEHTGWTVLYLHLASDGRAAEGTRVQTGDPLGRPSCEGGFSTATHMHIARLFNGEWVPATCHDCPEDLAIPNFSLDGWSSFGLEGQEYQGSLFKSGQQVTAEQGRLTPINRISW